MYHRSCSKETNLQSQRIRNAWNQERERERENRVTRPGLSSRRTKDWFFCLRGSLAWKRHVQFLFLGGEARKSRQPSTFSGFVCPSVPSSHRRSTAPPPATRKRLSFLLSFFPTLFLFIFIPFFPHGKNGKKTERVVNTGVVVQEAFNQRAWKILFTRSRTPHRTPLYVPIRFFTPAHAAPLHTGPTFHDWLLDFEQRALVFFPFLPSASFQRDLAFLIDSNGFVDFVRSGKSSIVIESFGKVTQLGGLPRAKNHDELLFNRLKMFLKFTWLVFAIGSF